VSLFNCKRLENLTDFINTVQEEKPADSWQEAAGSPDSMFGLGEHCKISNSKHQIPISNDQNRFGILKLGTRPQGGESKRSEDNFDHCDLFGICDLLFGIFSHSTNPILQHPMKQKNPQPYMRTAGGHD
jgi:hypothetical protein